MERRAKLAEQQIAQAEARAMLEIREAITAGTWNELLARYQNS